MVFVSCHIVDGVEQSEGLTLKGSLSAIVDVVEWLTALVVVFCRLFGLARATVHDKNEERKASGHFEA